MISKDVFESILKRTDCTSFLQKSSKESIEQSFGTDVANMVGYNQNNPNHHLNLFDHTLSVLDNLPKDKYSSEDLTTLKIAAFFHDVGKPHVAKEKNGKTTFINHAKESEIIATPILQQMGYSKTEVKRISFFIKHHDDFLNISAIDDKTVSKVSKILEKMKSEDYSPTEKDQVMLVDLCKADVSAQSEVIQENDEVKDTRQNRLNKYNQILALLPEARIYKDLQSIDSEITKAQKKLNSLTFQPKPIIKGRGIVNQNQLDNWDEWMSKPESERNAITSELQAQITLLQAKKEKLISSIQTSR